MTAKRIADIFGEALAWSEDERERRLENACGSDTRLRSEVESLLAAHDRAGAFMAEPSVEVEACRSNAEAPGTAVGRYRLLQPIGEGGFGTVYMAEQREPVQRRVAVKVIKLGMDTKQVIARFEAERQALAMMDHPNIARVFDAGETGTGRPYFVMELVRGDPITAYCDDEAMTIAQRLDLFSDLCAAVQHAHQKGIVHRDLKPSNILVGELDGRPTPKIIDFGIAKATSGYDRLTEKTLFTDFRQFVGTPEYMSPEQAGRGATDIDTRSDIYALGVLLYELLAGAPPFDRDRLRSSTWDEMRRIIREDEPPHPSTRLRLNGDTRDVASLRRTEPAQLVGQLQGDLDWVVMKCLEKDRGRRYDTASALAQDVGRHLAGEPVMAAPPSRVYRLRKFATRHKLPVVASLAVALALVLGTIGTTAGMVWALREADRADGQAKRAQDAEAVAERRAGELEQVAEFQRSQLAGLDADVMGERLMADVAERRRAALELAGRDEAEVEQGLRELEQALDGVNFTDVAKESLEANIFAQALVGIEEGFVDQPLVQAQLLQSMANVLRWLDMLDQAAAPQQRALEIRRRELGDAHRDTISSMIQAGWVAMERSRYDDADRYLREAVETARRALGEDEATASALNGLGVLVQWQGEYVESEALYVEALEIGRRALGEDHPTVLTYMSNVAFAIRQQGRRKEAEHLYRDVIDRRRRILGPDRAATMSTHRFLAAVLHEEGRLDEAERFYRETLEALRDARGDEHPKTLFAMEGLARLLREMGRLDEAEQLGAEAVRKGRETWPDERPPAGAGFLLEHAKTLTALGRFEPAELELLEALAMSERPGGAIGNPSRFRGFTQDLTEAFAELYQSWHDAEPTAGHGVRADEWSARLREIAGDDAVEAIHGDTDADG